MSSVTTSTFMPSSRSIVQGERVGQLVFMRSSLPHCTCRQRNEKPVDTYLFQSPCGLHSEFRFHSDSHWEGRDSSYHSWIGYCVVVVGTLVRASESEPSICVGSWSERLGLNRFLSRLSRERGSENCYVSLVATMNPLIPRGHLFRYGRIMRIEWTRRS